MQLYVSCHPNEDLLKNTFFVKEYIYDFCNFYTKITLSKRYSIPCIPFTAIQLRVLSNAKEQKEVYGIKDGTFFLNEILKV